MLIEVILRYSSKMNNKKQKINLTNGPGKLCEALGIDKTLNEENLCGNRIYIENNTEEFNIAASKRIGIDYAEEAREFLLRFYIKENEFVSK